MTWEEERNRRYHFRNIYHSDVLNIDRIHPLQQKIVINIIEKISNLGITKIVVIGSSLNLRCNPWSDLDIVLYGHLDGLQRANVEMKILSNVDGKISGEAWWFMSKLLRRAKARFESAKMQYLKISEDDAYLDMF